MWTDYMKKCITTQISKQCGAHAVLLGILKFCVSIKCCSSLGELISKFQILKQVGTCRIINNKC
jgi:hypothetical protein